MTFAQFAPKEEHTTFTLYSKLQFDKDTDIENLSSDTPVTGFAIHEGIFKKIIEIVEDELPNVERGLLNAQFRKDHGDSVDDVIGNIKAASVSFDDIAKKPGVFYKAFIDSSENKLASKVKKGLVKDVSIGFDFYPECSVCGGDFRECGHWFDKEHGSAHIRARNIDVFELSLVTRGADSEAKASVGAFKAQFSDKLSRSDFKKEEEIMVEEKPKKDLDLEGLFSKSNEQAAEIADLKAALQAQIDLTDQEKQAKEDLEGKLNDATGKVKDLEGKVNDITEKLNTTSTKLSETEKTEREKQVKEIVDEEIDKGLFAEEDRETRMKTLMEGGDLEIAKEYISKFQKTSSGNSVIGEFHNPQGENKFTTDEFKLNTRGEFNFANKKDMEAFYQEPDVIQRYVHQIFGYDKVFSRSAKDKIENQSYMGFRESIHDNGGTYISRNKYDRVRMTRGLAGVKAI
jgi:hypothetical protein